MARRLHDSMLAGWLTGWLAVWMAGILAGCLAAGCGRGLHHFLWAPRETFARSQLVGISCMLIDFMRFLALPQNFAAYFKLATLANDGGGERLAPDLAPTYDQWRAGG